MHRCMVAGLPAMHFQIPCCIDGSELVTGIGSRVLVYETAAGDLLHSLRGHKVKAPTSPAARVRCCQLMLR